MIEALANETLKIEISSAGAELQSIYDKVRNREYLWQGSPEWWPRRAPVLFPIVGKLNNNVYRLNGTTYSLPQHGFARDNEFQVVENTGTSVTYLLQSNAELRQKYPFPFELRITYTLEYAELRIAYEVKNPGPGPLHFSIGAHPGFALAPNESLSDYYLEFEQTETLDRHLLDGGLFNGETEHIMTDTNILALDDSMFLKDAIVLKGMKSGWLKLKSKKSNYQLIFEYSGFPYFGIWAKPGGSFLCLEPWCGHADKKGFEGDFATKEGVQMLNQGDVFSISYSASFGDS